MQLITTATPSSGRDLLRLRRVTPRHDDAVWVVEREFKCDALSHDTVAADDKNFPSVHVVTPGRW